LFRVLFAKLDFVDDRRRNKNFEEVGTVLFVCLFVCKAGTMLGKPKHVENISNDLEVDELANFAVTEHNNQTVSLYVLRRIQLSECVVVPQFFFHVFINRAVLFLVKKNDAS
jgi:hypothetical protein